MAKTFAGELEAIIDEQMDEIFRLKDENNHFRKASQEQRSLNGQLREENTELLQKLRALEADY